MAFYASISPYYDEIFASDAKEMHFVAEVLSASRRILDLGCGTGNKTVHFSGPGKEVVGVDSDAGMIDRANTEYATPGLRFEHMDMLAAVRHFPKHSFDAALCLGNTLVHLPDVRAMGDCVRGMHGLLAPGGLCVIQILNYDRILDQRIDTLPKLESEHLSFIRTYKPDGPRLRFITELISKSDGTSLHNEILLYPLRRQELHALLEDAGFTNMRYYGSYEGAPYTPESFPLIVVCEV